MMSPVPKGAAPPLSPNQQRSRIKHGWLEGGVLNPLRERRALWVRLRSNGEQPECFASFEAELEILRDFTRNAIDGYSLRMFADWGPFARLSPAARHALAEALHHEYLERSQVPSLTRQLEELGDHLEETFRGCLKVWKPSVAEERAEAALKDLEDATEAVVNALSRWPRGFEIV